MFTWNELVAIGIIDTLKDTELVIYFMEILKPIRRNLVEDEAREWHTSLRITQEDRWKIMDELSLKRKYQEMNASVPISCTLPFDGGMWRDSRLLIKSIRYFRRGFIKCPSWLDKMEEFALLRYYHGPAPPDEMENSEKIKTVNLMLGDTERSKLFRGGWGIIDIQEALEDFILFEEDSEEESSDDEEEDKPYVLVVEAADTLEERGRRTINIIG